jgi:hypothetical protein
MTSCRYEGCRFVLNPRLYKSYGQRIRKQRFDLPSSPVYGCRSAVHFESLCRPAEDAYVSPKFLNLSAVCG